MAKETPDINALIGALADRGYAILDDFLSAELADGLRGEALSRHAAGKFSRANIGRATQQHTDDSIRRDHILWLEESTASAIEAAYLSQMGALLRQLNRELFLGLDHGEFHYAHYPIGAFYKRHLDRFRDDDARTISCVCYLNKDWTSEDGGHLRLWTDEASPERYLDVAPQAGRLVVFTSDRFWHEVLAAQRERWSITGWLRRATSNR